MKILAILESPAGGEEKAAVALLRELSQLDFKITIKYLIPLKNTGLFSYFYWIIASLFRTLAFLFMNRKVEYVYTTTYTAAFATSICKTLLKKPIIFHYHGNRVPTLHNTQCSWKEQLTQRLKYSVVHWLHSFAWSSVDLFCVPSQSCIDELSTQFSTLGATQFVIPNGVDTTFFSPISSSKRKKLRQSFGISSHGEQFVIAIIGRLDPMKCTDERNEYIVELKKRSGRNITVVVAAPNQGNDQAYKIQIAHLLQKSKVNYLMLFDHQPISDIYHLSDCVLSHSKKEVSPLTLVESAACGVPFFATKNGHTEQLLNSIDKRLVLLNSSDILSYTADPALHRKLIKFAESRNQRKLAKEFALKLVELATKQFKAK